MDALMAWRPFREFERMRREMERNFSRIFEGWPAEEVPAGYYPRIESFMREGNIIVRADLPGVDPKELEISVFHDVLTIKGQRKATEAAKAEDYFRRELAYGPFERRVMLPDGSAADKIQASVKNGVVEITIPMTKEMGARKIPLELEAEKTEK